MDITNYAWYRTGRVTVLNGSTTVTGINTLWIKDGIKQGDIFILNGLICEIFDVISNTSLVLVDAYSGESTEQSSYKIIQRSKQVLQAEIAAKLEDVILDYNDLIRRYGSVVEYIEILKKLNLYIDEDGDMAQDETLAGNDFSEIGKAEAEEREHQEIQETIRKVNGMEKLVKATGIYVDEDGDTAQDTTQAGVSYTDVPEGYPVASDDEVDQMLDEAFSGLN